MNFVFLKNNKIQLLLFLGTFLLLFLTYQYPVILSIRPESIHQWRQTVCTSITLNYYQHGMNFMMPEVHHLFSDGGKSGQSLAELPIVYYFNALLWKIFGAHESISRIVNILICLLGALYLFKLVSRILSPSWALMITLLLFTSPVIAFYGFGFMVDVPALFICFISAYYFLNYYEFGKAKDFYAFLLISLLVMLLKVTVGIFFLSTFGIFVFEKLKILKFNRVIFQNALRDGLSFIIVLLLIVAWYSYAIHFDTIHGGWYTINDIFPIWTLDAEGIKTVFIHFFEMPFYQFFLPASTFIFLLLFFAFIMIYKKIDRFYLVLTLFLILGAFAYAILWFKVWDVHDYYLFLFLLPLVFIFLSVGDWLKKNYPSIFYSTKSKLLFGVFLIFNIWYCSNNIRMRYNISTTKIPYLSTKAEMDMWNWFHWNYSNTLKPLETMEVYNRSIGITDNDPVISIPDQSICITLYLMNQKGWTDYGNHFYEQDDIAEKIKMGAKYLILNDSTHASNPFINAYTKHKIGQHKNIQIYDLREFSAK